MKSIGIYSGWLSGVTLLRLAFNFSHAAFSASLLKDGALNQIQLGINSKLSSANNCFSLQQLWLYILLL